MKRKHAFDSQCIFKEVIRFITVWYLRIFHCSVVLAVFAEKTDVSTVNVELKKPLWDTGYPKAPGDSGK
jgi:hypothetical protein